MHQCIITQHPHLVETYEQFYNRDTFEPIKLNCDVENEHITKSQSTYVKLAAVDLIHW